MDPYIRALMEDGLDEVLAEWDEKDGLELMESEDEEELLRASRRADQQGGNPLFLVRMERVQERCCAPSRTVLLCKQKCDLLCSNFALPTGSFKGKQSQAFYQGLFVDFD